MRFIRSQWLVAALALLIVVVPCGCHHRQQEQSSSNTPSRDDGLPRTLAELDAWYVEPPAGQNAATFYAQGFDALKIPAAGSPNLPLLGKGKLPARGCPMPMAVKSAIAALVRSNLEALQFFARGAKCEQSRYPVDLTRGLETTFPHLAKIKSAAQLLELSAMAHAEENDGKAAAKDLLAGLGFAHSLEREPALLSQLVRADSLSVGVAALEQTLSRTALPPESLSELLKSLRQMEEQDAHGESFNRSMAGERATAMAVLASPQALLQALKLAGSHISPEQRNQITARLEKGGKLEQEADYLEKSFQQLIAARKAEFPERLKTDNLVRERVTEAGAKGLGSVSLLLSGLAGRAAREAECLANSRLGLTAVAIEQFRGAHENHCPELLSELAPEYLAVIPMDPFDGRPLRYRRQVDGYVLYSIGPDLKDDSGERRNGKEGDMTFSIVTTARQLTQAQ